jgi:hypothetical protein
MDGKTERRSIYTFRIRKDGWPDLGSPRFCTRGVLGDKARRSGPPQNSRTSRWKPLKKQQQRLFPDAFSSRIPFRISKRATSYSYSYAWYYTYNYTTRTERLVLYSQHTHYPRGGHLTLPIELSSPSKTLYKCTSSIVTVYRLGFSIRCEGCVVLRQK